MNILNKQLQTAYKGWSSGLGGWTRCLQLLTVNMYLVAKCSYRKPRTWTDSLVRPKQQRRDVRYGTWDVRSPYRAGSHTAAARELTIYEVDFVDLQEVRWDKGGTVREGNSNFFLWKRKRKSSIGNRIFCTPQNSINS